VTQAAMKPCALPAKQARIHPTTPESGALMYILPAWTQPHMSHLSCYRCTTAWTKLTAALS
jgi:hypothetical protein